MMGLSHSRRAHTLQSKDHRNILSLPTELLVLILSFLTARDLAIIRGVSRKLRIASEAPSLWKTFVWPFYYTKNEYCVNNLLQLFGCQVKRLMFPHHVTAPNLLLLNVLNYCSNVTHLGLPTINLSLDQLEKVLQGLRNLQSLEIKWVVDISELLAIVGNLKELTIKLWITDLDLGFVQHWVDNWISLRYVPQNLNIVVTNSCYFKSYKDALWKSWLSINPKSPPDCSGHLKLYSTLKVPLNFFPLLPKFQLNFGQAVTSSFVKASNVGLEGLADDILLVTDCVHGGKVTSEEPLVDVSCILIHNIDNLDFVIAFAMCDNLFSSEHLKQLAVVCPNLQRLNLGHSKNCLKSLNGLHFVANFCQNLQGLNLLGVTVEEVENQIRLWEILSDMKLTHLAVELCVLIPSANNEQKLISLFQKCTNLQALEVHDFKHAIRNMSIMSHFPSLIHCIISSAYDCATDLTDILTTCKYLKCLNYSIDDPPPIFDYVETAIAQNSFISTQLQFAAVVYPINLH